MCLSKKEGYILLVPAVITVILSVICLIALLIEKVDFSKNIAICGILIAAPLPFIAIGSWCAAKGD